MTQKSIPKEIDVGMTWFGIDSDFTVKYIRADLVDTRADTAQQSALVAAREALAFYADKAKYTKEWDRQFSAWISEIDSDCNGSRARQTIRQIDALTQEGK